MFLARLEKARNDVKRLVVIYVFVWLPVWSFQVVILISVRCEHLYIIDRINYRHTYCIIWMLPFPYHFYHLFGTRNSNSNIHGP